MANQLFSDSTTAPHQLTTHVKLLHKVALISNNKVLILKRAEQALSRPGNWDLPGGNSNWPFSVQAPTINLHQQDIVREIQEETGIVVSTPQFTEKTLVYFATFFEPDRQVYSINCGWVIQLTPAQTPPIQISAEHTEFAWITLDQLEQYEFGGVNRDYETKIIRQALA